MSDPAYLFLRANGSDIQGESSVSSLGREHSIECFEVRHSVQTLQSASGFPTQKRRYAPITIRKKIDKSSPLLLKALAENMAIEGKLLFFRPNPMGDGTTEQYYTIEFKQARISAIHMAQPNLLDPQTAMLPLTEEVSFIFHSISWTYTNGGVSHEDMNQLNAVNRRY